MCRYSTHLQIRIRCKSDEVMLKLLSSCWRLAPQFINKDIHVEKLSLTFFFQLKKTFSNSKSNRFYQSHYQHFYDKLICCHKNGNTKIQLNCPTFESNHKPNCRLFLCRSARHSCTWTTLCFTKLFMFLCKHFPLGNVFEHQMERRDRYYQRENRQSHTECYTDLYNE